MRVVLLLLALVTVAGAAPKKHQPGALVLLIDRSGSMQGAKLDTAKEAALAALETLAPTDQIASDEGAGRLYMVEDLGALPKIFMKEIEASVR